MSRTHQSGSANHNDPLTLLVVDDDPLILEFVTEALEDRDLRIVSATTAEEALALVNELKPRGVLSDLHLPGADGLDLMAKIHRIDPEIRVYIMTGQYTAPSAVKAIQDGAVDYLHKPVTVEALRQRVDRWIEEEQQRCRAQELERALLDSSTYEGIVGRSPALLDLLVKVRRVAPHCETALITGETGTGKESLARAVHAWNGRNGPFVVCNCAAIPETLFESELFGHKRGSFTGANTDRKGLAEAAEGGTLFLDEVGEVPAAMQAKLLRFLQRHEVHPIGAIQPRIVNVRVVAASNRNLREFTASGGFREDLFYRLSTVELKLPPLRDRREDLPLLIRHFLAVNGERFKKPGLRLTRRAETHLSRYAWPGNIRELENCLTYASMITGESAIDIPDFPDYLRERSTVPESELSTLAQLEYKHARRVLDSCEGNRVKTAELLGIGRSTLYRLLARTPE